ncbi:alpha-L-rhamnosidase-related protein [Streptomyces sp. 900105755]
MRAVVLGTAPICDALTRSGRTDTAHRLLLQQECPSWPHPVIVGAAISWERWERVLPDGTVNPSGMTSFIYYALGAVADRMHRTVARSRLRRARLPPPACGAEARRGTHPRARPCVPRPGPPTN